ncbi:glycosyltransferase [Caulobacter sp. 17J80-11]|uniref:glycosyltransferase n=1 Tax=Caulobacter sp. 17J80-11 TaxID=2763502 RepID=UPI001653DD35|nr:glycosyltransferase [Caulobacter sp. 17J80-11]MBC6980269.1 glycosyltransferase family 2 protein [Caulobacter sp. 17J80-11]
MPAPVSLQVVVCTYNRAQHLDATLAALSHQREAPIPWSVLVVDNASTDDTPAVVDAWRGRVPGLRRVLESEPGLTSARRRGAREAYADWIAFVDDDNLLAPDWIAQAAAAIAAHPEAGGFGGKIVLDFEAPPPAFLKGFGFCFAEQDHGEVPCEVDNLAGAGMLLRRAALEACGWTRQPLLADRSGAQLISGGDVEISQRVRGAGYALWYAPGCVLRHQIPASRMTRSYLLRMSEGLGVSASLVNALGWPGPYTAWRDQAKDNAWRCGVWAAGELRRALMRRCGVTAALAWLWFAGGMRRGVRTVENMPDDRRAAFFGAAARRA